MLPWPLLCLWPPMVWAKVELSQNLQVPADAFTPQPFPPDPETIFTVPLGAPGPWLSFPFRNQTTQVSQIYRFVQNGNGQQTWLHLVDGFCIGDTFSIWVDGQQVGMSSPTDSDSCQTNTTDPRVAWADTRGLWSRWEGQVGFRNQPGEHYVTLFVDQSPFVAGMAFARFSTTMDRTTTTTTSTRSTSTSTRRSITRTGTGTRPTRTMTRHPGGGSDSDSSSSDWRHHHGNWEDYDWAHHHGDHEGHDPHDCSICNDHGRICPLSRVGLRVIKAKVSYKHAARVCHRHGLQLAKLTLPLFLDATRLLYDCLGPRARAWIATWWGDDYRGACLELEGGNAAAGGSINVPASCSDRIPVLCQLRHS